MANTIYAKEWMNSILFSSRRLVIGFENKEQANPIYEQKKKHTEKNTGFVEANAKEKNRINGNIINPMENRYREERK